MNAAVMAKLLIVDDEADHLQVLCAALTAEGYSTRGCTSAQDALAALRTEHFDLLLTDLMMPEIDGLSLLGASHEIDPDLACIVMTGQGTIATAVSALKGGALDYILKPFEMERILVALIRALAVRRLQLENIQLRDSISIYELSRAITYGLDHDEVVRRTLAAAMQHSDAAAAYLLVPTADARELQVTALLSGEARLPEQTSLPFEPCVDAWVIQAREALEPRNSDVDPRILYEHPFGAKVGVALPVIASGKLFGVLGFSSIRSERGMSPGQLKALDILARTAALAFETASLVSQLRRVNQELELRVCERTRELELANKSLESFTYSISHDLREPLRAVEGFCEQFREEFSAAVPAPGRKLLERIWAGATRMNQLITDLLDFARLSREPLQRSQVRLRELVLMSVARLKELPGTRHVAVHVGEMPDCVGDRALLAQVVTNLLSNAFKFTAGCDAPRIDVGSISGGEAIVYYVRDNGVGFDMRHADKLFRVFQTLHDRGAFEGTGIGLSIVDQIIRRHGGSVWADSRPNQGTTLYFTLPAQLQSRAA